MGCCLCNPLPAVQKDPSVSHFTPVGDTAIVHGTRVVQICSSCPGVLYLQDDTLNYRCCKFYKYSCKLSDIEKVEVIHNVSYRVFLLNTDLYPGLKITVRPDTLLFVAVQNAEIFLFHLAHVIESQKAASSTPPHVEEEQTGMSE